MSSSRFRGFDSATLATRGTTVPLQLDMKSTVVRRPQSFDYRVLRRRFVVGLKAFLQHCLWIGRRCRNWISVTQFLAERAVDEAAGSRQSAIDKDRANDRFKHVGEQSSFTTAATFLFATPEPDEIAERQLSGSLCQSWGAHQTVFHARQLAFAGARIGAKQIISDQQTEDRITEKLKRFVVQSPGLRSGAR